MSDVAIAAPLDQSCWTRTGIWGNRTCTELSRVSHCRNCEVYSASGRRLLDRAAPAGYIESCTALLVEDKVAAQVATVPHLLFRVGQVWLAFLATSLREITEPSVVRSVPHRARDILRGLVNVRGELHPCVSLHAVFGEQSGTVAHRTARFLVARWAAQDWVFPVDEVDGVKDLSEQQIEPLPATLTNLPVVYTRGLFHHGDKTVAIIAEDLLFGSLLRRIS